MRTFDSILLLKVPYSSHPDALSKDENFRARQTFRPIPSLALPALCAFVDKYKTYDYHLQAVDINIEGYTKPGVPIDTSCYLELMEDWIKSNEYDVLGLSVMFVSNVRWVDTAVSLSRQYHPEAKIIIGGSYPTLFPERCLREHDIDDAVIGEGEATFLHILNQYNNHHDAAFADRFPFEGYATKDASGTIVVHPRRRGFIEMEDIPAPAWRYLNIEAYFRNSGDKSLPIEDSRGCPYSCTYCCTDRYWGKRVRYKPIDNLTHEITELRSRYGNARIEFIGDNVAVSKEWVTQALTKLIEMDLAESIDISSVSVKHLDEEIVGLLLKLGVKRIRVAVETGSKEMQQRIRKKIDFDKLRELVRIMKSKGAYIHLCWMIGFPNETLDQINETFDLARELRVHSNQFMTVVPYPGTRLYEEARARGLLIFPEDDLDKYDYKKCDYIRSDEWNYEQLQEMTYDANIEVNFLDTLFLESDKGREYFLGELEGLLKSLPGHVIGHIVAGFIYGEKHHTSEQERHYETAIDLLKDKQLRDTFGKYLLWDHAIMGSFRQHTEAKGLAFEKLAAFASQNAAARDVGSNTMSPAPMVT